MADPVISFWNYEGTAEVTIITFGKIEEGFESESLGLRVYNNKDEASDIADAENCRLCAVDDHTVSPPTFDNDLVKYGWIKGRFTGYDGSGVSETFSALGGILGALKHWMSQNDGIIEGSSGGTEKHYASIELKIAVPAGTARGTYTGSPVLEYTTA